MKNAFAIFKSDIFKIKASWVMLVIMFGLIILPPIYAWINIYASWDPYGNTNGIQVAVVNKDVGASLNNIDFDIGSELISSLKTNDKMDWVFCDDTDEAIEMAQMGDVYATIIIPPEFSEDMTTVLNTNPIKPRLEYYVNEKENAIAPKMTDAVANSFQKQITANIILTAVSKAFEKFNKVGVEMDDEYPNIENYINMLFTLNKDFPNLDNKLAKLSEKSQKGIVMINKADEDFVSAENTMKKTIDFNENFSKALLKMNKNIQESEPEIKENLITAQSLFSNISKSTGELADDIVINKPKAIRDIDYALNDLDSLERKVVSVSNQFNDFNKNGIPAIVRQNKLIISDIKDLDETLADLKNSIEDVRKVGRLLSHISELSSKLATEIDSFSSTSKGILNIIDTNLASAEDLLLKIENFMDSAKNNTGKSISQSAYGLQQDILILNKALNNYPYFFQKAIAKNTQIYNQLGQIKSYAGAQALSGNYERLSEYIGSIRTRLDIAKNNISSSMYDISDTLTQTSRDCSEASSNIDVTSDDLEENIDDIINRLDDVKTLLNKCNIKLLSSKTDNLKDINTKTSQIMLRTQELKSDLNGLKQKINDKDSFEKGLYDVQKLTYNIQSDLGSVVANLDDDILPRLENSLKNGSIFIGDINTILSNSKEDVELFRDFLNDVSDDGAVAIDKISKVRSKLPNIQKSINHISNLVENIDLPIGFDNIVDFLKKDAKTEGDFISSPIDLKTHKIYSMKNYGTGLTPFYTVLSIWVGSIFLAAILSTKSRNTHIKHTSTEEYFGKFMLFGLVAILQGLVVALGDIFIMKIPIHNPILFTLLSVFYSIVFTMIVYSLVVTLGNVGKAFAILYMLLQLTGSGGIFPIQVMPKFFQTIHSLLPFTYAINGMREAIFGVVFDAIVKDILILIVFLAIFTILGTLLKKPLEKLLYKTSKQLRQTNIMGH